MKREINSKIENFFISILTDLEQKESLILLKFQNDSKK